MVTEPSISQGTDRDTAAIDEAAQDWLLRRTTGSLSAAEQARFQAWHDSDPRHRAAYAEVDAMWRDAGALEHVFVPQGGKAAGARPRNSASRLSARPVRAVRWRGFAAVPALLATAGLLCFVFLSSFSSLPSRLMADHATAIGEQKRVVLPDGSVALLNTGSAIDVAYSEQRRIVTLLQGEAWFEVKKNAARPFDVVAAGGRVTAVGTAFAVRHEGEGATVTVTEGVVRVTSPDTARASVDAARLLEAGQQVNYRQGAAPGAVRTIDGVAATAWRDGSIVFRDRTLGEALAEIGRYRAGRVILLGDRPRSEPITARLSLTDVDGGIDALAATQGLSVTRVTNWLVIVR